MHEPINITSRLESMLTRRIYLPTMALTALMLCSQTAIGQVLENKVLTFGVVPQQATEKLAREWVPLINLLSETTGLTIEFATAPSIPEFEARLAEGFYDFAYMNPYHFTMFNDAPGYVAIARQRDHVIQGIIVVSSDLGIESLEDLSGKNLAFPAPRAFAATMIPRTSLDEAAPGHTATFVNSHDSVYQSVAKGLFAGGGGIVRTLNEVSQELQDKLRVLWVSPGYTGHAFAAHPQISAKLRGSVQRALIDMASSEKGAQVIRDLGMNGFINAVDSDWDDVRALHIE
ncbi:phosphate/phosphite/phosphonate ABC transporter substrate-binding protein [Allohahella sp. A8]|uniref:phosphate/phosphite/phosphonate ABC transporter substrate-binding protein n=1 Tax=Allohahella sp. A8 TaxID=3141461 RepID=UPI003A80CD21